MPEYFKGGAFQICGKLIEKIGKEKIFYNHAVTEITQVKQISELEVILKTSVVASVCTYKVTKFTSTCVPFPFVFLTL